ncbi:bifunctional glutamate--cysteine ligase GshA/glutathione synthetase GshB [Gemelliphila palaticanis]|uniref:Glutathione biosynthesis bifunctional protein GshAB n=1 Tax=Gemelliphila palaticanis TaxID=81950 RepID=A0ABX2SX07_9BACL|nr:bifunctional glutamate--cysteine ligase GshA/glutathione synthetase GshB [Gemella palaticanis]MBF0714705.1 bifunctional glutamate--cysteine ligase GshA/glutathione synthetase GshB [Gemella palaticanis]NYS46635.1 bifunctional glutamate--cysteine ligase GshA/glutathione synthetase GshB [Gemella palaticanis]
MNIKKIIRDKNLFSIFEEATIGIEKEGQRVLLDGSVTTTDHPKNIGNRQGHPYIQTDFAESQVELITPPGETEREVYRYLSAIHEVFLRKMPQNEYIWPMSMPAILPKEELIRVAQFDNPSDVEYREYLVDVYGKYIQMVSGIHYNFGFSQKFIDELIASTKLDEVTVRNELYMKLARQFIRYQWILVYLMGSTPIAPNEYFYKYPKPNSPVRSLRTSKYGYVNDDSIKVSFDSVEDYARDVRYYVDNKQLIAEKEFYSSVRFRGSDTVLDLAQKGIKYLEFRLFDINPFAKYGITEEDIRFIHLFAMNLVLLDEEDKFTSIKIGKDYSEKTALAHPLSLPENMEEAKCVLNSIVDMLKEGHFDNKDIEIVQSKIDQLSSPENTIGGRLWTLYEEKQDMAKIGMELAVNYKNDALEKYYSLTEFSNMELSTQALISDAISEGITVDILDEQAQFLKLSYKGHIEYVKNGNMTNRDNYISHLIMENKVVTKKVLEKDGFRVPKGYKYQSIEAALRDFSKVKDKAIVVKPKSTNYGLGISIFSTGIKNIEDYKKAVTIALKEDKEIIVEEFIFGTEYRFFVLDGETKAVLLRVPAHVTGDGLSTIEQLVIKKNNSPLRGDGLSSPLKKIKIGEIEELQLKEQGYTKETILKEGEIAYLRANSNISTGGDSIDVTDDVHDSYKKIAVEIANSMFAKVCGVDIIIENIKDEANDSNYGIIEANFNPMMMMHIFPYKGKSRRLTEDVLKMLFPEKYN